MTSGSVYRASARLLDSESKVVVLLALLPAILWHFE